MATRLIIDGNAVYEIDEDCQECRQRKNGGCGRCGCSQCSCPEKREEGKPEGGSRSNASL